FDSKSVDRPIVKDDRSNGFVKSSEFPNSRLIWVRELKSASSPAHCILVRPSTVQGKRQLVVSGFLGIRPSKRGHVHPNLLHPVFEVSQLGARLPEFPFSCPPADLGAILLPSSWSTGSTELCPTAWPPAVVDEGEALPLDRTVGSATGARAASSGFHSTSMC